MSTSKKSVGEEDLVDLAGKVALVTGGNTGIGYGTIQFLARKGAKVYMAARSESRALAAIKQLESEGINEGSVHWLKTDLSDLRSLKASAEEFKQKENRLDILVNNAAIGAVGPYSLDENGLRNVMVVNHLSHFVLTEALLPLLKETARQESSDVRIINVTSMAHSRVNVTTFEGKESLNKEYGDTFNGYLDTYGYSKLANILHVKELQSRLDSENVPIICMAVHPGPVNTVGAKGFLSSVPYIGKLLGGFLGRMFFTSWRTGAMTSAFAAASPAVRAKKDLYKGAYLVPIAQVTQPSKCALDERLAKELYTTSVEVIKEVGV
ncbi:NAD-P-binding protein [Crucibulum laeve]|uniref:NAD-P-binding protein n=1 Tax=Crucibulum laeve TaxID=68775 RepID=A0A5C3M445_9AGAR|nr:NAD-P-binding protein [Crucibulum laeve]